MMLELRLDKVLQLRLSELCFSLGKARLRRWRLSYSASALLSRLLQSAPLCIMLMLWLFEVAAVGAFPYYAQPRLPRLLQLTPFRTTFKLWLAEVAAVGTFPDSTQVLLSRCCSCSFLYYA